MVGNDAFYPFSLLYKVLASIFTEKDFHHNVSFTLANIVLLFHIRKKSEYVFS